MDAIGETALELSRDLQDEAGFADASRAGQGDEGHVIPPQQIANGGNLPLPPDERRTRVRQKSEPSRIGRRPRVHGVTCLPNSDKPHVASDKLRATALISGSSHDRWHPRRSVPLMKRGSCDLQLYSPHAAYGFADCVGDLVGLAVERPALGEDQEA